VQNSALENSRLEPARFFLRSARKELCKTRVSRLEALQGGHWSWRQRRDGSWKLGDDCANHINFLFVRKVRTNCLWLVGPAKRTGHP